jgi:AcrR family transcriptional regulator
VTATLPPATRITNTAALRRVPVQGRSVARVQRMLDACAAIVDEVGYEGLTTTLLAEKAGVAIGSVYQFFPDKRAVVQALIERNLDAYLQRLAGRCAAAELTGWWEGVAASIDEYVQMHRTVPGFRTLHQHEHDTNSVIAERLADLLAARFEIEDSTQLRTALTIAVEAADALIRLAFRRCPDGDEQVLAEAKVLVRDYLDSRDGLLPVAAG